MLSILQHVLAHHIVPFSGSLSHLMYQNMLENWRMKNTFSAHKVGSTN